MNNKGRKFLGELKLYSDFLGWVEDKGRYETYEEAIDDIFESTHKVRYSQQWEKLASHIDFAKQMCKEKRVLTAMRHLQFRGNDIFKHQFRGYNCVSQDTEFITDKGVKSFCNVKEGETINVWTHKGRWKKAIVKKYGKQKLNKIIFKRGTSNQVVRATANHRWYLDNGEITDSLKIGDVIQKPIPIFKFNFDTASPFEKLYWCYGYVYGDGTKVKKDGEYKRSMVRLCGDQIKFAYRFEEMGFKSSSSLSIHGDLIFYTGKYLKTLPDIEEDDNDLIQAFMCGYLDADGYKNNNDSGKIYNGIQCSSEEGIEFLRQVLPTTGFFIYNEKDKTGQETNYGIRPHTIEFSITNTLGSKYNRGYIVHSIEEGTEEDVWCLEVEEDHSFTLKNGVVTGNCLVMYADKPEWLGNAFYLSLCGCGVGVNMMLPFVERMPRITARRKGTKTFVIPDSIEGWTDASHIIVSSYIDDSYETVPGYSEWQGYEVKFDYSKIRVKGAKVGRRFLAPGSHGLRNSLDKIEQLLNNVVSNNYSSHKFTTQLQYDCFMHLMNAVLSGGIRRAAASVIFSPEDEEMLNCKSGEWYINNKQRERSNNSVGLVKGTFAKEDFLKILALNKGGNDIGFVIMNNIFEIYNPCFEIGFTPLWFPYGNNNPITQDLKWRVMNNDITVLDLGVKTAIQCCNL